MTTAPSRVFLCAAALALVRPSAPAGAEEVSLSLGLGRTWVDVEPLNRDLQAAGLQTYTRAFAYRPGALEINLRSGVHVFGFEAASHDNLRSDAVAGGFQNNNTFFGLFLSYGRAWGGRGAFDVAPRLGFGFAEMHHVLQPHAPDGLAYRELLARPASSSHLVTNGLVLNPAVALNYILGRGKGAPRRRVRLAVGLRTGYLMEVQKTTNPDRGGWVQHGQPVNGAPRLGLSGPYVRVQIGVVLAER